MDKPAAFSSTTTTGIIVGRDLTVHNGNMTAVVMTPAVKPSLIVTQFRQFDLPTPNFMGREALLELMDSLMVDCQTKSEYTEKLVVLYGCGGIGKTELARTYAKRCASNPAIHNVAWINAESLAALTSSFTALARKLKLKPENKSVEVIVQEVYEHFSEYIQKGLFIFDNTNQMNDEEFGLINYMPEYLDTYPLFLITTRDNKWDDIPNENKIQVQELSKEDAVAFLIKRIQLNDQQQNCPKIKKAVSDLAEALQGYPLALAVAGSNIPNPKSSWSDLKGNIDEYIKRMNVPQGGWSKQKQTGAATKYKFIMDNVWDLTLKQIKTLKDGEEALKLLYLLAYVLPDDINLAKIGKIYERTFDRDHKKIGLHILEQYSLISIYTEKHFDRYKDLRTFFYVRVHRLIQLCTRDKLDKVLDFSYLLGHCKYILQAPSIWDTSVEMGFFEDYSLRPGNQRTYLYTTREVEDDLIHIHRHLKLRSWPGEFVAFSVFFTDNAPLKISAKILEDVNNYFMEIGNDRVTACEEVSDLCYLYLFVFKFKCNPLATDFLEKCNTVFVKQVGLYIQQLLLPAGSPKIIPDKFRYTKIVNMARIRSFKLCQDELLNSNPWRFKHLITRVVEIVKETVASTTEGCRLDSVSRLYQSLWGCNWNMFEENPETAFECARLASLAFAKHIRFWPLLKTEKDHEKYWSNWEEKGPLPVFDILVIKTNCI